MTIVFSPATALPSLSMLFEMRDEFTADLCLRNQCAPGTILTVIHQVLIGQVVSYLILDQEEFTLTVADGQVLHVTAHMEGTVVGCGIFEIDTHLADVGALLIPRTLANLIVDQCPRKIISNGIKAGLERCTEHYRTDPLPPLAETETTEQAVAL